MYLKTLKLWNFRKFGSGNSDIDLTKPDLEVPFARGLNVLIGENDSGKTAIIDAVKLVLDTHTSEWVKLVQEDFYKDTSRLRIECRFKGLSDEEAKYFIEWLGMDGEGKDAKPYLKVILNASRKDDKILPFDIVAGADDEGHRLLAEARYYLKTIYLKPLRDAKSELIPRRSSRLSQILSGHDAFKSKDEGHILEKVSRCLNCLFQKYFRKDYKENKCTFEEKDCPFKDFKHSVEEESPGKQIQNNIQLMINRFLGNDEYTANFGVIARELKNILEQFKLSLSDEELGLGSHNLLFIAAELMNLQKENWSGLRLALIEELEAHLEPQRQMRLIEYFEEITSESNGKDIQIILTTHSPNLASKVKLENLIICHDGQVFPMGKDYTKLGEPDYGFLERFLDVTKANLFFAKGVILVEGPSEELILPVLAKKNGMDLTRKGVSVVNVGNKAFLRYAKIFQRGDEKLMKIPVAVVTDLDIKPDQYNRVDAGAKTEKDFNLVKKKQEKKQKYNGQKVETFISPHWTLEYCIARSKHLAPPLYSAIKNTIMEMRQDGKSISEITETYDIFANGKGQEILAFEMYQKLILDKRISKPILAQHFAKILEEENITEEDLSHKESTKYLVDAIKYVTG